MMLRTYTKNKELGDFIKCRRQSITPTQIGLPQQGKRRTPGLRREEVASLAGIGLSWYTWLEQGREIQVSAQVLLSIGQVFQLNNDEMTYLLNLAGFNQSTTEQTSTMNISPPLQHVLDHLETSPSIILNAHWDIIAWNKAASIVFYDFEQLKPCDRNLIKLIFLNDDFKKRFPNWQSKAKQILANFRLAIAETIENKKTKALIESMRVHSPEFNEWWQDHTIQIEQPLTKIILHPQLGALEFEHTSYTMNDTEQKNLKLYINTPKKGSTTEKIIKKVI